MLMNPQRLGKGLGGHTRMQWDEILGTSVWEASKKKKKKRYFCPDNLPHSLCPDLLFLSTNIWCFYSPERNLGTKMSARTPPPPSPGLSTPRPQITTGDRVHLRDDMKKKKRPRTEKNYPSPLFPPPFPTRPDPPRYNLRGLVIT